MIKIKYNFLKYLSNTEKKQAKITCMELNFIHLIKDVTLDILIVILFCFYSNFRRFRETGFMYIFIHMKIRP